MTRMIPVTATIAIDPDALSESFVRSSGPGGQNVNKVSTAVMLRFDVLNCATIPDGVKARLAKLAGSRMTKDGVLILTAQRHASQLRNREDAQAELVDLIRRASVVPVKRRPTRPTHGATLRRLEEKSHRSKIKKDRTVPND